MTDSWRWTARDTFRVTPFAVLLQYNSVCVSLCLYFSIVWRFVCSLFRLIRSTSEIQFNRIVVVSCHSGRFILIQATQFNMSNSKNRKSSDAHDSDGFRVGRGWAQRHIKTKIIKRSPDRDRTHYTLKHYKCKWITSTPLVHFSLHRYTPRLRGVFACLGTMCWNILNGALRKNSNSKVYSLVIDLHSNDSSSILPMAGLWHCIAHLLFFHCFFCCFLSYFYFVPSSFSVFFHFRRILYVSFHLLSLFLIVFCRCSRSYC